MGRACYAAVALCLWVCAGLTGDVSLMALACAMALLAGALWALARVQARLLACEVRACTPEVERGGAARFELVVTNRSWLPAGTFEVRVRLGWRDDLMACEDVDLAGTASGRSELRVPLAASAAHCGVAWARVERVSTADPLGLFRARRRPRACEAFVVVLPARLAPERPYEVGGIRAACEAALGAAGRGVEGAPESAGAPLPPDVADVRPWREGDPLRSVHWKLSARMGETMVRLFEREDEAQVELCCDARWVRADEAAQPVEGRGRMLPRFAEPPTPAAMDALFEAARAISCGLLEEGVAHRMSWADHEGCDRLVRTPDEEEGAAREAVLFVRPKEHKGDGVICAPARLEGDGSLMLMLDLSLRLWLEGRVIAQLTGAKERGR